MFALLSNPLKASQAIRRYSETSSPHAWFDAKAPDLSHYLGDLSGQVFVFFILTVAAAESAIGLAILVALFRNLKSINVADLNSLKG